MTQDGFTVSEAIETRVVSVWDPRSYEDTDYGLDPGESFEPDEDEWSGESLESLPHVMTVLGAIEPDELGVCLPHEHILCDPVAVTADEPDYRLDNPANALAELDAYVSVGGRGIVDCSTQDYGRDIDGLVALAQRVPVHIIAVTGRHKDLHARRMENALDVDALVTEFVNELRHGAGERGSRPGLIKFGTSLDEMTPVEEAAARAAARASIATGVPITTHTEEGTAALTQLNLLAKEGVDLRRVIVGHLDRKMEWDYLLEVLKSGAFVSFDQVGKARFGPDEPKAEMIVRLAEAGYADHLLLSHDFARKSDFISYGGGPGLIHLLDRFTLTLMDAGAPATIVRTLLIDNTARALTIWPTAGDGDCAI